MNNWTLILTQSMSWRQVKIPLPKQFSNILIKMETCYSYLLISVVCIWLIVACVKLGKITLQETHGWTPPGQFEVFIVWYGRLWRKQWWRSSSQCLLIEGKQSLLLYRKSKVSRTSHQISHLKLKCDCNSVFSFDYITIISPFWFGIVTMALCHQTWSISPFNMSSPILDVSPGYHNFDGHESFRSLCFLRVVSRVCCEITSRNSSPQC